MPENVNDNDGAIAAATPKSADPHGQVALLLVESLIHGLIARTVISVADAVEIVGVAHEVKQATGAELGDSPADLRKSLALLSSLEQSLSIDLGKP